jgi:hypothetical protein
LQVSDDPDGKVLATLSTRSADGLAPPDIDPFVLIGMAQIGVAIGKGVGKYLARRAVNAGRIAATSFRQAMAKVEKKLLARGAAREAASLRVLTEEQLSMIWGGGGERPPLTVDAIDMQAVLACLKPHRQARPETASRLRGRIEAVLDAAAASNSDGIFQLQKFLQGCPVLAARLKGIYDFDGYFEFALAGFHSQLD